MKNKINKLIFAVVEILIITILFCTNITYASFAEFDDETADKQANEDLKEQEAIDKENHGKSSNNFLEQLSVKGYEITPKFDKQTINYSIEQDITDNEIEIMATSADSKATVNGDGKVKLQSGENELRVDVVAENGITRTYFIKITKKVEDINSQNSELTSTDSNNTEEIKENTESPSTTNENEQNILMPIILLIAVVIVIAIILLAKKSNRSKH